MTSDQLKVFFKAGGQYWPPLWRSYQPLRRSLPPLAVMATDIHSLQGPTCLGSPNGPERAAGLTRT
eukprot:1898634-Amphidinium_carterae.1